MHGRRRYSFADSLALDVIYESRKGFAAGAVAPKDEEGKPVEEDESVTGTSPFPMASPIQTVNST